MGRRRGFFAELHHQAKQAERRRVRAERESERRYKAALRDADRARKAKERAAKQLVRAVKSERKRLEKEAKQAHVEAMNAEVESRNLELATINADINSLLEATLDVDDYVDLETLRMVVKHPPFEHSRPLKPIFEPPPEPTGLFAIFRKAQHVKAVKAAREEYEDATAAWEQGVIDFEMAQERYQLECTERETQAFEHNQAIETLITNLGYGVQDAVEEYLSIVLSNSVYPHHFPVNHDFSFDPEEAELQLRVLLPGPSTISSAKVFRYVKSKDEISSSSLSQKAQKDRYASAVHQVALRSLHEVFEADRRGLVNTITLEVGTEALDPATGKETYIPFVSVGAERQSFLEFDLSRVVPLATLKHLGAAISKNPFGLVAADTKGIRRT